MAAAAARIGAALARRKRVELLWNCCGHACADSAVAEAGKVGQRGDGPRRARHGLLRDHPDVPGADDERVEALGTLQSGPGEQRERWRSARAAACGHERLLPR